MTSQSYALGSVELQYGGHLPDAQITYKTHGTLNAARDNVIVFPTWCAGRHPDVEWIIGPDWALDPSKYFIVVVDMFGNGMSSSPSNTAAPFDRVRFPRVSILDNVRMQRRLLEEVWGIERIRLVIGRSMGAQLAFQWGAWYPERVERILPMCGSARTAPHNYLFITTMKMALKADPAWLKGEYAENPEGSLRNMRLNADAWGFSQEFYRQGLHLSDAFPDIRSYAERPTPAPYGDVNDLLAQYATWEVADISDNDRFNGDFEKALSAITARSFVMPSRTDLYFPPEDSVHEVAHMPNAELKVIESVWGHRAASPGSDPVDIAFFNSAIADLLSQ